MVDSSNCEPMDDPRRGSSMGSQSLTGRHFLPPCRFCVHSTDCLATKTVQKYANQVLI